MRNHRRWIGSLCAGVLLATVLSGGCGFDVAPHPPFPAVSRGHADVLSPLRLVSLVSARDPLAGQLLDAGDRVMASAWLVVAGIEAGVLSDGSVHAVMPRPPDGTIDDERLGRWVQEAIDGQRAPAPDGNSVYLVWLPDGVTLTWSGQENRDCRYVRGYHRPLGGGDGGDVMAVVQRCPFEDIDDLTVRGAHELIEAATDPGHADTSPAPVLDAPWSGSPWSALAAAGDGIADLCAGTRYRENGVLYPRVWADHAARAGGDPCIPSLRAPYFNTAAGADWYPLDADGAATVTLTGWSTSAIAPWYILTGVGRESDPTIDINVRVEDPANPDVPVMPVIGNGGTLTLTVRAGSVVTPGFWATVDVDSFPDPSDPAARSPDAERYHRSVFGVYAP